MNELEQTLTSLEVAEMVEKTHANLLKDIRRYCKQLGEVKIDFTDFFTESSYQTEQGKELPCYKITKKGCEFIAHKLTGTKGTAFTARYINKFHDMEQSIKQLQPPKPQYPGFPSKHPWLIEMEDNFKFLCNAYEFDRKTLYHKILEDINKTYTVDDYKVIYKYQNGHAAEYVMEVVAFFPELREEAEKTILFHIEKKKNIKQEICTILKENNVSQAEIARRLGYSATIFYDKMKMFSFKVAESKKIARLLGCEQMAM